MLAFLLNKWTLRIGAVVLVLISLWAWGKHRESQGKEIGKQDANKEWSSQIEQMRAEDRKQLDARLAADDQRVKAADERLKASQDRETVLISTMKQLSLQHQQVSQAVANTPDPELHALIVRTVGLRPKDQLVNPVPGYTYPEERAIAECVGNWPICKQDVIQRDGQITEIKGQIADIQEKLATVKSQAGALKDYNSKLEGYYTLLYNAQLQPKRSAKCLWLWKCGKPKLLPVPAPAQLGTP